MGRTATPNHFTVRENFTVLTLLSRNVPIDVFLDNDPHMVDVLNKVRWYASPYKNTSPFARMDSGNMLNLSKAVAAMLIPADHCLYGFQLKEKKLDFCSSNILPFSGPKSNNYPDSLPDCSLTKWIERYKQDKVTREANRKEKELYILNDDQSPDKMEFTNKILANVGKPPIPVFNDEGDEVSMEEYTKLYYAKLKATYGC